MESMSIGVNCEKQECDNKGRGGKVRKTKLNIYYKGKQPCKD